MGICWSIAKNLKLWRYFVLCAGIVTCSSASAQTFVYEKQREGQISTYNYSINRTNRGHSLQHTYLEQTKTIYTMSAVLDNHFNTLEWTYSNPEEKTTINAQKKDNNILLKGIYRGNAISKSYIIDEHPWKEFFPADLSQFVVSDKSEIVFWCIAVFDPGAMEIGEFSAKKDGEEVIKINGKSVNAVHLKITFTDWKSVFWQGDFWCRREDGQYVLYKGVEGPGGAEIVTILVREIR